MPTISRILNHPMIVVPQDAIKEAEESGCGFEARRGEKTPQDIPILQAMMSKLSNTLRDITELGSTAINDFVLQRCRV